MDGGCAVAVALAGGAGGPSRLTTGNIVSATNLDGEFLIETDAPHGLSTGEHVTIAGNTSASANVTDNAITVVDATRFTLDGTVHDSDGTGGTWTFVPSGGDEGAADYFGDYFGDYLGNIWG